MRTSIADYWGRWSEQVGCGWNRFWYTPSDPLPLCILRILIGTVALCWQLSYTPDLLRWFGPAGLLPASTVRRVVTGGVEGGDFFHPSYFYWLTSPAEHWIVHIAGALVLLMFTLGLFTRISSLLSLVVILSYLHRAPMITGQLEPVLTMLVAYLCLGPTSACLSLDRRFGRVAGARTAGGSVGTWASAPPRWTATLSTRLIQVHLAGLSLMIGLTMLGGETWWAGDAVWWLIAQSDSRLVDLSFLRNAPLVINAWTHCLVLFYLTFGVLVWHRLARPLLLGMAILMWLSVALVTGLVGFCLTMVIANLAFVPAETMRGWFAASSMVKTDSASVAGPTSDESRAG